MPSALYASYREIGGPNGHLANKRDFVGNSMSAYRETTSDGIYWYVVKSYATVIATHNLDTGDSIVSDGRYSVTTSRHQNLCRAWL